MTTDNRTASSPVKGRTRLAIIGGGPAALVAAFHLTRNEPDTYEITIYEMSWRLGGKTVSGRGEHGRIEEHGLHILFGCYHNVFHTMRVCYDELRELVKPDEHRLRYFYDAISPHHFGVIGDDRSDPWAPIHLEFPSNRGVPGDRPLPSSWDLASTLFQLTWMVVVGPRSLRLLHRTLPILFDFKNRWKRQDFSEEAWESRHATQAHGGHLGGDLLSRLALKVAKGCLNKHSISGKITLGLNRVGQRLWQVLDGRSARVLGRWWTSVDFFYAVIRGLITDGVLSEAGGFERIDDYDLRSWLVKHGASEQTRSSPWLRVIYDAAFSYPRGGITTDEDRSKLQPGEEPGESIAAGAALRALLLMTLTYKGCFYNKMEAGMGDVIHTPLYLVLKKRGVKFEFFHKLTDVKPVHETDGSYAVDQIEFDTLPEKADYDPLVSVSQLLCWPSSPRVEQLSERSRERALVAESYAPTTAARRSLTLERGRDFDAVILGTPVACLPYVCPTLLAVDGERKDGLFPSLSQQFQIETVQTIALQLWLKPSLSQLGWKHPSPLLSLFKDPLNTWCDMTQLAAWENWPTPLRAGNVSYFCGALPHLHEFPPPSQLAGASEMKLRIAAQIKHIGTEFLEQQLAELLPSVRARGGFNYSLLIDPLNGKDSARFEAAYLRANYEPHALCTLARPGKTKFRIKTDRTGFSNLFVTGDWIDNGVYLACVEGAFQSGIRTARAVAARFTGQAERYRVISEDLLNLAVLKEKPDQ